MYSCIIWVLLLICRHSECRLLIKQSMCRMTYNLGMLLMVMWSGVGLDWFLQCGVRRVLLMMWKKIFLWLVPMHFQHSAVMFVCSYFPCQKNVLIKVPLCFLQGECKCFHWPTTISTRYEWWALSRCNVQWCTLLPNQGQHQFLFMAHFANWIPKGKPY